MSRAIPTTVEEKEQQPGATRILRHKFKNFLDVEHFLERNHDSVEIRPAGTQINVATTLVLVNDLRIWRVRNIGGYELLANERPSRYWICFSECGAVEAGFGSKLDALSEGKAWIRDSEALRFLREHPGFTCNSFDVPHETLRNHFARAQLHDRVSGISFDGKIDVTRGAWRLISKLTSGLLEGVNTGMALTCYPSAARSFSNLLLDLLVLSATTVPGARENASSTRSISCAVDFIEANLHRPLSIMDLADAAGVSPRALQIGFQRRFGCSPMAHVRRCRLAKARQDLMSGGERETIADIAVRWGFFHLGLFARQYRDLFGELPSHTQRKGRIG